jgi:hypothetical protein
LWKIGDEDAASRVFEKRRFEDEDADPYIEL